MWPVMHDLSVTGLQADALFASTLQRCDERSSPGTGQRDRAVFLAGRAVP
jgi:hypothetical protein